MIHSGYELIMGYDDLSAVSSSVSTTRRSVPGRALVAGAVLTVALCAAADLVALPAAPEYPSSGYPASGYPAAGYPAAGYPAPGLAPAGLAAAALTGPRSGPRGAVCSCAIAVFLRSRSHVTQSCREIAGEAADCRESILAYGW